MPGGAHVGREQFAPHPVVVRFADGGLFYFGEFEAQVRGVGQVEPEGGGGFGEDGE